MPPDAANRLSSLLRSPPVCVIGTLLLAWAAAALCVMLRTPLPWMIGPLLVTAIISMLGGATASWTPLRDAGQWIIGCALGLYFTPQVVALVAGLWWAIALNIVWALALGLVFGAWLHRVHHGPGPLHVSGLSRITTYFAAPIGAASEMTLMGERHGAQTDLVASAHSLRVLLVTLIIPFGFQWAGLHGLDTTLPGVREVHFPGLALLAGLTGIGCWTMLKLKRTNPWFIGALLVSLLLTACGFTLSALPPWMTNAAQLVIGISLGVRFTRRFVHLAPRWLGSVALATVGMMVLCAGFAWMLARFSSLHWATLLLGTLPGGIAEMAITAKVLQLGVPVVTAFHVTRLAAVLLLAEPMYRWLYQERPAAQAENPPAE
ncbi:MAG: AbrB family transcriptional regulator [Polaromonas sp.]|uniref:AbrB family transcriptional regulator n=1 Tax=Polaromonas sp. TaxID=1869339 RepID=UPI0027355C1E|nr:AbrB family transcriptional regulator [Polaromonas sp.]MDP3795603.1 AbrB family transcriptional regulator [Polaromonas sp.]